MQKEKTFTLPQLRSWHIFHLRIPVVRAFVDKGKHIPHVPVDTEKGQHLEVGRQDAASLWCQHQLALREQPLAIVRGRWNHLDEGNKTDRTTLFLITEDRRRVVFLSVLALGPSMTGGLKTTQRSFFRTQQTLAVDELGNTSLKSG